MLSKQKLKEEIESGLYSKELIMQAIITIDKQVSKYAYLKKKYANAGHYNDSNIKEFNQAIRRRNILINTYKDMYYSQHKQPITQDEILTLAKEQEDLKMPIKTANAFCERLIDG